MRALGGLMVSATAWVGVKSPPGRLPLPQRCWGCCMASQTGSAEPNFAAVADSAHSIPTVLHVQLGGRPLRLTWARQRQPPQRSASWDWGSGLSFGPSSSVDVSPAGTPGAQAFYDSGAVPVMAAPPPRECPGRQQASV